MCNIKNRRSRNLTIGMLTSFRSIALKSTRLNLARAMSYYTPADGVLQLWCF